MNARYILTVIGTDRTGIVDALASVVSAQGGSWQKSRMARLSGHFAGIVEIAAPEGAAAALSEAFTSVPGLDVVVTPARESAPAERREQAVVSVVGHDRQGIVRAITRAMAELHVNVVDFESHVVQAPMSGDRMFEARVEVELPPRVGLEDLRRGLEGVAEDLMVDVGLLGA